MPLPGVCPSCGAKFSLEQALTDPQARAALAAALACPAELAGRIVSYLGLHAPPARAIHWPKLTRLITELSTRLSAGEVTRNRVTRAAPQALWMAALDEVLAARDGGRLDLPLDGHGLLDEIAWRMAGRTTSGQPSTPTPSHGSQLPAEIPARATDWTPERRANARRHIAEMLPRPEIDDDSTT